MRKLFFIFALSLFSVGIITSQTIIGTYAIQNTVTNKNLRPYDAGNQNGNRIVLYNHVEWKCMTWDFVHINDNTYQLKNLFTSKTFQPKDTPAKQGSTLEQQPLSGSATQQWEFIKGANNNYLIRLKGTELYITASSSQTNSDIVLQPVQKNALQQWRLVAQNPDM
ncbi:MAG: RICIN domain-containing protein [Paludibacter sp.]|nr:RICIN domain-containing protein [Paludibacter sp.]